MMDVEKNTLPTGQQFTAFFEGNEGESSIDYNFMKEFLKDIKSLTVKALGPSHDIQAVARAMRLHHRNYYFVVDRDHHEDSFVDRSWKRFPDPECDNFLMWRKRMFESYLLDPDYLCRSNLLKKGFGPDVLKGEILRLGHERGYRDAANFVIARVRENMKSEWITFIQPGVLIKSADEGLSVLVGLEDWQSQGVKCASWLTKDYLTTQYQNAINRMFDGAPGPEWNRGQWRDVVDAKPIFHSLVNQYFFVGNQQRKSQWSRVAHSLASLPEAEQPEDFVLLRTMIQRQVDQGDIRR
jgi:hypothetical protein